MFKIEIKKYHFDGTEATEQKSFRNEKDMYQYLIFDMLETTLDNAREDLDDNAFTSLCLHICGFMAEYFT